MGGGGGALKRKGESWGEGGALKRKGESWGEGGAKGTKEIERSRCHFP